MGPSERWLISGPVILGLAWLWRLYVIAPQRRWVYHEEEVREHPADEQDHRRGQPGGGPAGNPFAAPAVSVRRKVRPLAVVVHLALTLVWGYLVLIGILCLLCAVMP